MKELYNNILNDSYAFEQIRKNHVNQTILKLNEIAKTFATSSNIKQYGMNYKFCSKIHMYDDGTPTKYIFYFSLITGVNIHFGDTIDYISDIEDLDFDSKKEWINFVKEHGDQDFINGIKLIIEVVNYIPTTSIFEEIVKHYEL